MRQPQTPAEKAGGHTMGQVCLRPGEEKDIFRGKRWIYDNEIAWAGEDCQLMPGAGLWPKAFSTGIQKLWCGCSPGQRMRR